MEFNRIIPLMLQLLHEEPGEDNSMSPLQPTRDFQKVLCREVKYYKADFRVSGAATKSSLVIDIHWYIFNFWLLILETNLPDSALFLLLWGALPA